MKEVIDTVSVALANGDTENVGNVVMQEVNRTLLSAGVDEVWADKIDNLIVLLFIIGIALLANIICRKIILRVVAKLVKQTKATWDDIVFNHKVMVNVSRMVAPILIYIAIPIAFPEHADSDLLDFLRRLCLIYIIAVFLRFISALFTAVYQVYSERGAVSGQTVERTFADGASDSFLYRSHHYYKHSDQSEPDGLADRIGSVCRYSDVGFQR